MENSKINQIMLAFLFGLCMGALTALTIIREAVPLQSHVWSIGLASVAGLPIFLMLFFWYKSLLKSVRVVLGEKGGGLIGSIVTFQVTAMTIIFLIVLTIFFAAIA